MEGSQAQSPAAGVAAGALVVVVVADVVVVVHATQILGEAQTGVDAVPASGSCQNQPAAPSQQGCPAASASSLLTWAAAASVAPTVAGHQASTARVHQGT